jgi:6-phosphogluconolactonase
MPVEHRLDTDAALADALAQDVAARLRAAIDQRCCALLAVSGGRSPIAFLQALGRTALDWGAVTVILVDERCVPSTHPDSNTALVRQHLLRDDAAVARFIPFFEAVPAALDDAALTTLQQQAEARLAPLPWPVDVAMLGMGLDGHTASLFPGAPGTAHALTTAAHCAWVRPLDADHPRLTLTLATLLQARHLALQMAGPAKQAVYARALQGADPRLPVSLLLCQKTTPIAAWIGA